MTTIIPISDLVLGMYVEQVIKQKGNVRIKSRGLVKSEATLNALKQKGILEVEVNIEKSTAEAIGVSSSNKVVQEQPPEVDKPSDVFENAHLENPNAPLVASEPTTVPQVAIDPTAHQESLEKANQIYGQAKHVQEEFVKQLRSGATPNLSELNNLSQDIIDSVIDNADALSCLIMLKNSDEYLVEHAINCSILLAVFARSRGMSQAEVEDLTMAGLLMDIGMASLPRELLSKTEEFSEADWIMIRSHIDIGIELIERLDDPAPIVLDVIQNHHERVNGSGYPKAKTASELSVHAQMAAIVDSYDAMISNRGYKTSDNATIALQKLEHDESLDRDLVQEFITAIGLHPVGSLVQLESRKLAIVSQRQSAHPLHPIVMVFYSLKTQLHTEIHRLDLSQCDDNIVAGVRPEEFKMSLSGFFKNAFLHKDD
jgi:HD-GYP domain-containing protein (c-di-GMP phosphodiesterase class II)